MPKAELHLHLEGSIGPALLRDLIRQDHRSKTPSRSDVEALYRFKGFQGFLQAYARICSYLSLPAQLQRAVLELGRRLRRENVLHAEVFFSPGVHARNGMSYPLVADALERGAECVEKEGGPSLLFLADGVRQWGPEVFGSMVSEMSQHPSKSMVGVGLGGDEMSFPARDFQRWFQLAHDSGLRSVVHAGETGPPGSVQEVIDWLHPHRIAHGIQAAGEPRLLEQLRIQGLTLDVCLTSNLRTGVVPRGRPHPLATLVEQGVPTTLGTDDPALFRTTLSGEFARAARLGLDRSTLARLALQGASASLLPAAPRQKLLSRINAGWSAAQSAQ